MIKALFTYDYGTEKMKKIEELGYEIVMGKENNHAFNNSKDYVTYNDELKDVEMLSCYNPFTTLDIGKMTKLKWIQLSSIGVDQVPKDIVNRNNIIVTNNRGGYSIPIAEWIVMSILQMMKNTNKFYKKQQNKIWKMDGSVLELYGKTVGFVGTGTIAIEAAKRLSSFGVKILGVNTKGRDIQYFDKCYSRAQTDDMLSRCDVVVGMVPGTKATYHLFNEDRFKAMKDGVLFVNSARGSIVDENELIKNLKNGKVRAAALDVFEQEPLSLDNPLWEMENVIVSPHNSWISEMRNERRFNLIYNNMRSYIRGEELSNIVNLGKGY
ncbi:phosphoglycerate dehydrogenase [Clostridium sediminicola]|uniref:phosphoglycerate dehydrogenase n=1 Tax=Clostridium sediminicola TaxID=3114879 RepID=UPI0031F1EE75